MKTFYLPKGSQIGVWLVAALLLIPGLTLAGPAKPLLTLKSGTLVYSNVTVFGQSETDLYISHARGLENIKISSLDHDSLVTLGLASNEPPAPSAAKRKFTAMLGSVGTWKANLNSAWAESPKDLESAKKLAAAFEAQLTPTVKLGLLAGTVGLYLFFCFCLRLVCCNAGLKPGILIWLPLFQLFPMVRAARMPAWSLILFLLPGINFLAGIWWSFQITKACGKGKLTAVLLILPITGFFAFLYLAFSKNTSERPDVPVDESLKMNGLARA